MLRLSFSADYVSNKSIKIGEKNLKIFNLETKKGANIKKLPYANSDANKLFIFAIIEFSINMHMFAIQHLKQTLPAVLFTFHKRSKIHPLGGAWGKKFFKSDKDSPPHHRRWSQQLNQ